MIQKIINEIGGIKSILSSSRPKIESLSYVARSIYYFIFPRSKIKYLGRDFYYKDRNTPILLQWYPQEIESLLSKSGKINTCLDIGANIGQFAYTLRRYLPHLEIVSIEPQKEAVDIMKRNVSSKIIEASIGKGDSQTLYVEEGKSDRTSPIEGVNKKANKKIIVRVMQLTKSRCKSLGIKTEYDLIKIDVEGGEAEVIECIKELKWKFLQIESTNDKVKKIESLLKKYWGNYSLIYKKNVTSNSDVINYVYSRLPQATFK